MLEIDHGDIDTDALPPNTPEESAWVRRTVAYVLVNRDVTAEQAAALEAAWRAKGEMLTNEEVEAIIGPNPPLVPEYPYGPRT